LEVAQDRSICVVDWQIIAQIGSRREVFVTKCPPRERILP
jgi:hypothetical protein